MSMISHPDRYLRLVDGISLFGRRNLTALVTSVMLCRYPCSGPLRELMNALMNAFQFSL